MFKEIYKLVLEILCKKNIFILTWNSILNKAV